MIRKKLKKTTKQYIIVALICVVVMGGAATFTTLMLTNQVRSKYSELLEIAHQEMESNQRTVYKATIDIAHGDYLTEENITQVKVYSSQPQDTYITKEDIGKIALVDIKANTHILKNMLSGNIIDSGLREVEFNVVYINTNVVSNDTVDVRLVYPNGENYIVLSKKIIKGYTPETTECYFWLNEEEILKMSAAIVDAALYPGSKLYVTKYIEPNIQDESIVNYIPSLAVLKLIEEDPNIVERSSQELNKELRKSLENRLASSMDTDISEINWDVNPNITSSETKQTTEEEEEISEEITPGSKALDENEEDAGFNSTTGSEDDYFYYSDEKEAVERDTEYGE